MKTRIRRILKFAAAILLAQTLALLFLTPAGIDFMFPPVARVNAEKFSPDSNTYAVYYDIRVEVSQADLIVVGVDHGIAESFDLHILRAVEEESGSETSAKELTELISLIKDNNLPAIFTEINSSAAAAKIIAAETGVSVHALDMGISSNSYFEAMYHNIDTIKEALG